MSLNTKVSDFISGLRDDGEDLFPYLANKDWESGKPFYYSGPYWDDLEAQELIYAVMKGKWLASGERVNIFEKEFSTRFGFDHCR